jgi:hypothetical protein
MVNLSKIFDEQPLDYFNIIFMRFLNGKKRVRTATVIK